jgi:hypothetical protein
MPHVNGRGRMACESASRSTDCRGARGVGLRGESIDVNVADLMAEHRQQAPSTLSIGATRRAAVPTLSWGADDAPTRSRTCPDFCRAHGHSRMEWPVAQFGATRDGNDSAAYSATSSGWGIS